MDLGQNKFTHAGFNSLFRALIHNSVLDSLDLSNEEGANKDKSNSKAFSSLTAMLEGQKSSGVISILNFGNIGLGDIGVGCIAASITGTKIRKLGLRANGITC